MSNVITNYIAKGFERYRQYSQTIEISQVLCGKVWHVFNNEGNSETLIFRSDGTIIKTINGIGITGEWHWIDVAKSISIRIDNFVILLSPTFKDNNIFALTLRGTSNVAFLIEENRLASFPVRDLNGLLSYFRRVEEQRQRHLEQQRQLAIQEENNRRRQAEELERRRRQEDFKRNKEKAHLVKCFLWGLSLVSSNFLLILVDLQFQIKDNLFLQLNYNQCHSLSDITLLTLVYGSILCVIAMPYYLLLRIIAYIYFYDNKALKALLKLF